jgi:drug/metabolite transporter (DMT)-like permease
MITDRFSPNMIGISLVLALSVAGVLADAALKVASGKANATSSGYFLIGAFIYALTAFGWVWAMRHLKLAQLGAFYSVSTALLLAVVGVVFFQETLRTREVLGILLGVASLVLLTE